MAGRRRRRERRSADVPGRPAAKAGAPAPVKRAPPAGAAAREIPRWVPWAVAAVVTLILFRGFVFGSAMLVGNDTLSLGYVARAFFADALRSGEGFPLWAPRILGGTPFLEALSGGDSLYPPSLLLLLLLEPYRALGWKLVLHVFAAGPLMFAWLRTLGASRAAALVSGTAYMVAPFLVSLVHPGHDGKIFVTALAPLMFLVVERFFQKATPGRFAAVALVVALVISTTHFQMGYFLFAATGAFAFFRAVQQARGGVGAGHDGPGTTEREGGTVEAPPPASGRPRAAAGRFLLFLAAALGGAAAAGVQLVPAAAYVTEYSRRVQTTREAAGEAGVAWSSSWSLHPEEAMSLVIPEFAGNNANGSPWSSGTYWGRNVFKDNHEYAGLVVLLLAAASFGGARRGLRRFLASLAAVAFLFALGAHTPVWRIFYEVVPGIRLFRAPSQAMFLFGFSAATLAGLGVDRLMSRKGGGARADRVLWGGAGVVAVLALLAASGLLTRLWTSVVYPDIDAGRLDALARLQPFLVRGAFTAALLAGATAGAVWLFRRGLLPAGALVGTLVLLVAADGMRVDSSFVQTMDFDAWAAPDPTVQAILDREAGSTEPYRLFSMAQSGQDVKPSLYGIELAAGHHPNDLSRYRELIGMVGSSFPENLLNPNVRRILNVRYILWPDAEVGPAPDGLPVVARSTLRDGRTYRTLLADAGLPRARLVASAVVRSDDEAVAYILSEAHDPSTEVVLAEEPPVALDGGPVQGSVTWEERSPNRLVMRVTSDRPALLVVGDNWFPAWRATVDGAAAPVLRAYHTVRAVPVPAGRDMRVEMTYHSTLLARSAQVSGVVLLLLLSALASDGVRAWRRRS